LTRRESRFPFRPDSAPGTTRPKPDSGGDADDETDSPGGRACDADGTDWKARARDWSGGACDESDDGADWLEQKRLCPYGRGEWPFFFSPVGVCP